MKEMYFINIYFMSALENASDYFSSSDFSISVVLIYFNYHLAALNRSNPNRIQFLFERGAGLDELVADYWAGRCKVEPKTFFPLSKNS
jgi:hypothetical protein